MKNLVFYFLLLLQLACTTPLKKPFYYEIKRGQQVSHVLGTIHSGFEASQLPSFIHQDLEKSAAFASEISKEYRENYKVSFDDDVERSKINFDRKTKVSKLYKANTWAEVKKSLLPITKTDAYLESLTPRMIFYLYLGVQNSLVLVERGTSIRLDYFMDRDLYKSIESKGKTIVRLDTPDVFDQSCFDTVYVSDLERFIESKEKYGSSAGLYRIAAMEQLFEKYESGDEASLIELTSIPNSSTSDEVLSVSTCLYDQRNQRWAKIINEDYVKNSPMFIAVGVGHLIGNKSLLDFLREKGFSIRRRTE